MGKFKQRESLVAVATKGSLTATARAEGGPAVIGRRIDALEERLGSTWRSTGEVTAEIVAGRLQALLEAYGSPTYRQG